MDEVLVLRGLNNLAGVLHSPASVTGAGVPDSGAVWSAGHGRVLNSLRCIDKSSRWIHRAAPLYKEQSPTERTRYELYLLILYKVSIWYI